MSTASQAQGLPATPQGVSVQAGLELCLMHAAALHERPISQAMLSENIRPEEQDDGLQAGLRAADMAGLETAFGPLELSALDDSLMPAVALTETGAVVIERRNGRDWIIFDPRLSTTKSTKVKDKALRASLSGMVILLRPKETAAAGETGEGHWFRSALAANKWSYIQVAIAAALANVLGLTTSIFIMVVYDRILPSQAIDSLIALTAGVGVALTFDFIIKTLRAGFIDRAGQRADLSMGRAIFNQLLSLRLASRSGSTGAMASSLREFESLRDFFTSATLVAIVDLPFILLFVFVISLIGGPLAIVPMVAVPVVLVVALLTQPFLRRLSDASFQDGQSKQSVLVEALTGLESIKAGRGEGRMKARWEKALGSQAERGVKQRAITQFAFNATALVQQTAQIAIVFYGVLLITDGVISMGALIASVILTGRALTPLSQIAQTLTRISQTRTAYGAIDTIMKADSERPANRRYLTRDTVEGRISFHKVTFKYPRANTATLDTLSFDIAPGERVAILGPIGSGKSTIGRMILGLYQPDHGSIRLDGTDIQQIDPGDLRRHVGAVLQDNWLFSGSLRENIAMGAPKASDSDILRAAKISGVDRFVSTTSDGYDMIVGERGEGLSGGQRQSIALARAVLEDPAVLLLDEPTSAMDVMTEKTVIENLATCTEGKTLIMITHRSSVLELVDRIIVVQGGKIVADGPKDVILGKMGAQV